MSWYFVIINFVINSITEFITDFFVEFNPLIYPGSRLYYLNICFAAVIALIYFSKNLRLLATKKRIKSLLKNYWFCPSSLVDCKIFFLNTFIEIIYLGPFAALGYVLSRGITNFLNSNFGEASVEPLNFATGALVTFAVFAFDDFLRFIHHYLYHKIPFLWELHKVPHSASVLTPVTLYRVHPIENVTLTFFISLSVGMSSGVLVYFFSSQFSVLQILGVNAFVFLFNLTFSNLRHSHLEISFGPFERFVLSPKQHQMHHSDFSTHYDKNFGVVFSLWDQIIGTYVGSKNQVVGDYGVKGLSPDNFKDQLFKPLAHFSQKE